MPNPNAFNIPIAKPTMMGDEHVLIQQSLDSGWVSMGPLTKQFEALVASYTGAKYAVATTSWTTAFHVAMLIHGIGAGDEVICPSYSFIATANVVCHAGATPRFADIDPNTLNIDPKSVEQLLVNSYHQNGDGHLLHHQSGNRLKAIMIVHQIGIPADIDAFAALCKQYNLLLLEDSACALGSTYKNQPIGHSGFTGAFSFHPRKVITTGEGGMLLLNDEQLAEQARIYRAHGMSISDLVRHQAGSTVYERYDVVGYNYRMTDIQAAIGIRQMEHLDDFLNRRQEIAAQYNQAFSRLDTLALITPPDYVTHWNYQSYPIRLLNASQATRDAFMQALEKRGIASRRGIPGAHLEPVYNSGVSLPHTELVSQTSLFLPIFPLMTDAEVQHVIDSVLDIAKPPLASGVMAG